MNRKRTYLSNSNIEIIYPDIIRGKIKFAIFDFDGTVSLIREGWQQIMNPMIVDILMPTHQRMKAAPKSKKEAARPQNRCYLLFPTVKNYLGAYRS